MQHDHHCIVTWMSYNWRIVKSEPGILSLRCIDIDGLFVYTQVDISRVDWEAYMSKALEMDYEGELNDRSGG